MLLVMLYEAALFIAILLGLATGYLIFELLTAQYVPYRVFCVLHRCCTLREPT